MASRNEKGKIVHGYTWMNTGKSSRRNPSTDG